MACYNSFGCLSGLTGQEATYRGREVGKTFLLGNGEIHEILHMEHFLIIRLFPLAISFSFIVIIFCIFSLTCHLCFYEQFLRRRARNKQIQDEWVVPLKSIEHVNEVLAIEIH